MTPDAQRQLEYAALRATIRERGTVRMALVPVIFIAWAAIAVATGAVITVALSTLVPLMVLVAGFEGLFALHTNVERIGRYLQVFHEESGGWEHVAMEFGQRFPGGGPDPLFGRLFGIAISINYLPAALGGSTVELIVLALLHFIPIFRIRSAQAAASRQRAIDLERFTAVRGSGYPQP